jgi:prepilin-type N-terminal cleavage/methylation domain-containing protein
MATIGLMCTAINPFNRGFSLIELGIVAAIIAIMVALLLPRFNSDALANKRVETAIRQLKTDLLLTRQLAINSKIAHHLNIDTTSNTYAIYSSSIGPDTAVSTMRTLHKGVTISGDLTHSFTRSGTLINGTSTFVQLSQSGQAWRIDINGLTGYCLISKQ